jgi:hypothetical protein
LDDRLPRRMRGIALSRAGWSRYKDTVPQKLPFLAAGVGKGAKSRIRLHEDRK